MDINKILIDLGLDLSNPDVKQGAMEAIEAILLSRQFAGPNGGGFSGGGSGDIDVEIDPDLLQPSIKQSSGSNSDDIEINDEEKILDQVKHNKSETDSENNNNQSDSSSSEPSDDSSNRESTSDNSESASKSEAEADNMKSDSESTDNLDELETGAAEPEKTESEESTEENELIDGANAGSDSKDSDDDKEVMSNEDDENNEYNFDEEDFLDDTLKKPFEDSQENAKHEARKIKRERTLAAAEKALADAKAKKVSQSLIHELESAVAALAALTEAAKNIKNISDEEFNQLINRVLDAIDAVGDKSLSITTDEERELRAKEIKADLASAKTQNELSAEDIAKIRDEHQALKAREKEKEKYAQKARSSFKGFQDFLLSLYRAIALQVNTNEIQDSSWSAISRRNSGAGVLQQGKLIRELPDGKIPVIDFYFDQSGSWSDADLEYGRKAVQSLTDLEAQGRIKINIYYFADDVHVDAEAARRQRGTGGWNEIVKNIIATNATNVIIMTDSDMENWWNGPKALSYTVPGFVWYLWKNGVNAPRLPRDLKGKAGTLQYAF